jgi:hypothetical protein
MRTIRSKRANRTIFEVGDKVRLTVEGERARMQGQASTILGVVLGVNRSGHLIRVKKRGQKTSSLYAPVFWEAVDACERCEGARRGVPGNENRIVWGQRCRCMDPNHHKGDPNKIRVVCDNCHADEKEGLPW